MRNAPDVAAGEPATFAMTRTRAVFPAVAVVGVHAKLPRPYRSIATLVATVCHELPLSVETCTFAVGLAAPVGLALTISMPLMTAVLTTFDSSSAMPALPLAVTLN